MAVHLTWPSDCTILGGMDGSRHRRTSPPRGSRLHVLMTGSSGQVGTNLGLALLGRGHSVVGVDRRSNPWSGAFLTVIHDLTRGFPPGHPAPDVVVHLAAHAKVHELVLHPERALENVRMTCSVLEYCRSQRIPIVLASSREVYGNGEREVTAEDEVSLSAVESPYAASKLASEAMVTAYARSYGLPYLIFRLSNVYGRYDNDLARMERVIPLWIEQISRGEPITVYGPEKVLDFTYVDDCVAGLVSGVEALAGGELRNQTLNLAYGQGWTLLQLAELIGRALDREPRLVLCPRRPGEIGRYVANVDKARRLLGYDPQVPLDEGIVRAVAWSRA